MGKDDCHFGRSRSYRYELSRKIEGLRYVLTATRIDVTNRNVKAAPPQKRADPEQVARGKRLEAELVAAGKTQAELALFMGVNPSTVSHWVNGRRKLTIDDVEKIAEFLGIDPSKIAWGTFGTIVEPPAKGSARKPAVKKTAKPVTTGLHPRAKKGAKSSARPGPTPTRAAKNAHATGTHG